MRKLEKLLEDVEMEKSELQAILDEVRERLRVLEAELGTRDEMIEQLRTQLVNSAVTQPTAAGQENVPEQAVSVYDWASVIQRCIFTNSNL